MRVIPIYPVYNEANCYIVACGTKCAVVDPGAYPERIIKKAYEQGIVIEKILLTHAHFDHIMAVNELAKETGATVLIHKDDKASLYEPCLNLSTHIGQDYRIDSAVQVEVFENAVRIFIGEKALSVLHTPGHTPGSVCFIGEDFIISGDTLFAGTIGRTDFPGSDHSRMLASLGKLKALGGDYKIYPGHSAETTLSREKQYNYYLQ